uniref:Macaca fascicularis brain cDNA, clone: QmoA-11919 n=1 Tax=Macaca fascicularis TaxID=9541 RepID=I7GPA7_MACFA|nr:unnamed protein product [Macaca fascicularis]
MSPPWAKEVLFPLLFPVSLPFWLFSIFLCFSGTFSKFSTHPPSPHDA